MRRRFLIWLLIPLFVLGGFIWLASQEWTLQWIAGKVVQAGGGHIEIEGVSGTLVNSLEVEKISFSSPEKDIEIDSLVLVWNPWKLLRGEIDIERIAAERIAVDMKQSSDEPFVLPDSLAPPLAIRVAQVEAGVVSLAKAGIGISLEQVHFSLVSDEKAWRLDDFGFDSPFGNATIRIELGMAKPHMIDGTIRFENSLNGARADVVLGGSLERLAVGGILDGYGAAGKLDAVVTPFAGFPFESVRLDARGIDPSVIQSSWPQALLDAQVDLAAGGGQTVKGQVSVQNRKAGSIDSNRIPVRFLGGKIGGLIDRITLSDIVLDFGKAGRFDGNGLFSAERTEVMLATTRFDLHEISSVIRQTHVGGNIRFIESEGIQEFRLNLNERAIRLNALVRKKGDDLLLEDMLVRADDSILKMTGRMSLAEGGALALGGQIRRFNFADFGKFPSSDLNADIGIAGTVKPQPDLQVRYAFLPSRLLNQPLSGQGRFRIRGKEIRDADLSLALGANSLKAAGNLGQTDDSLRWELDAPDLKAFGTGWQGTLAGDGELRGVLDNFRLVMHLNGSEFLLMDRFGARKLQADIRFGMAPQDRIAVDVKIDDAKLGSGNWKTIRAQVDGTGRSHTLQAAAQNDMFDLSARASGGFVSGSLWKGELESLENRGRLSFVLVDAVPLTVGADDFSIRDMVLKLPDGRLTVQKFVRKGNVIETSGSAKAVPLAYLLAISPDASGSVHTTLKLGADWSVKTGNSLDGQMHLYRENGDITLMGDNVIQLGLDTLDVQMQLSGNTVNLDARVQSGKAGNIAVSAMTRLTQQDGSWGVTQNSPLQLSVHADMPSLAWIAPLTGQPDIELGGALALAVRGSGTLGNPDLSGTINGKNLAFNWLSMGVSLSKGELAAVLDGNRLQIRKGIIYGPQGNMQIGGAVFLKNGQLQTDLHFETDRLQILSGVDRKLSITGKGQFALDENKLQLNGNWRVNQATIILADSASVTYSKDVIVLGRPEKKAGQPVPVNFNLTVDLGNQFYLKGKGLDTRLEGKIQAVSSQDNRLRVFGTINTVNGTYSAFGQKLTIAKGEVMFGGPVENPTLNILAVRKFPQTEDVTEVGVSVRGSAQSPKVQLVSTPEVSDTEKLSWLVLGDSGGEKGDDQQRAMIATAAAALLSTEQSGGLPTRLASTIGLDDIDISSSSELDETVLSLTKRISSRLYLTYEQGLTGATNLIKLRYIISRHLSLVGQTGTITAVDLFYDWRFD